MANSSVIGNGGKLKATRKRAQLSCDRCRLIKRKCDRVKPCGRCSQDNESCSFDRAQRTRRKFGDARAAEPHFALGTVPEVTHLPGRPIQNLESPEGSATSSHTSGSRFSSSIGGHSSRTSISSDSLQDANARRDSLCRLLARPVFLKQLLDIYFREVEWTCDLLADTRVHRLVAEYDNPADEAPTQLWTEVQPLLFALVSAVAQQCRTDIEFVLIGLDSGSRDGFLTSSALATSAYKAAEAAIADLVATIEPRFWPAEAWATTMFLRNYDKSEGKMQSLIDHGITDLARFLRTDIARSHMMTTTGSETAPGESATFRTERTWKEEHDLLAYRVFWAFFHNDRVASMYTGSPYLMQPQHLDACLRDPMGHLSVQELCDPARGARQCSCSNTRSTMPLPISMQQGLPVLSAYKGASARLAAITGRYFDRLSFCRDTAFQWPQDAERMALDLDADLLQLENGISQLAQGQFQRGQKEAIFLCVAALRGDVAKRLCEAFAVNLRSRERALLPEAIDWMLQRRSLDTAKALILRAIDVPRSSSMGARVSWYFFPKFVQRHTMDLLKAARRPIARQHDAEGTNYLLDCLRHGIIGRNFMVLLTRRSELPAAKRLVDDVCACAFDAVGGWLDDNLGNKEEGHGAPEKYQRRLSIRDPDVVVDEAGLILEIEANLPAPMPLPSTTDPASDVDFRLDETLTSLFADLPALEQLFGFVPA